MSKSKKKRKSVKRPSEYCIITESAYENRHFFKAASVFAAIGLSLSAVAATIPGCVSDVKTVSLDVAANGAYVRDVIDVNSQYSNEVATSLLLSAPELSEEAATANRFSAFVTSINDEETQKKLDLISEEKKALAEAEKKYAKEEAERRVAAEKQRAIAAEKAAADFAAKKAVDPDAVYGIPASSVYSVSEKTPPEWLTLDENGVPNDYRYIIRGKATAYYGDPITATGTRPIPGSVAVDPKEIPYGTKMYITSGDGSIVYGYAVAEDTGGFANWEHGATVDLFMNTYRECVNWGWRDAVIYIL